jgi:hypothetical protein
MTLAHLSDEQLYQIEQQALLKSASTKKLEDMSPDELNAIHTKAMQESNPFPDSGTDNGPIASLGKFAYGVGAGAAQGIGNIVGGISNMISIPNSQSYMIGNKTGLGDNATQFAQNAANSIDSGVAGKTGQVAGNVAPYLAMPMNVGIGVSTAADIKPDTTLGEGALIGARNLALGKVAQYASKAALSYGSATQGSQEAINAINPSMTAQDIVDGASQRQQNVAQAGETLRQAKTNLQEQISNSYKEASPNFKDVPINNDTWNNLLQDPTINRNVTLLNKEPMGATGTSEITKDWSGGPQPGEPPTVGQVYALKRFGELDKFNQYNQPINPDVNDIAMSNNLANAAGEVSPQFTQHMNYIAPLMAKKSLISSILGSDNKVLDLNSTIANAAGGETKAGSIADLNDALQQGGGNGDNLIIGSMAQNAGRSKVNINNASLPDQIDTMIPNQNTFENYMQLASPEMQQKLQGLWAAKQTLMKAHSPSHFPVVGHYIDQAKSLFDALSLKPDAAYLGATGPGNDLTTISNMFGSGTAALSSFIGNPQQQQQNNNQPTPLQQQFQ